jgi:lysophospholipase L1-like esterase
MLPPDRRICFVGDSFVQGTGDPACLGWVGRLCAATWQAGYPLTVYNLGVRRETTAQIAARWQAECTLRLPPDCDARLVFSFGVNDTTVEDGQRRLTLDASRNAARALLTSAQAHYPVLLVGPPPVADAAQNKQIAELSEVFGMVAAQCGVPYLPIYAALHATPAWMQDVAAPDGDGSHPRDAGYAALANLVQQWSAWWFC